MQVTEREYRDATVRLDGCAYVRCRFIRCTLEYHGSGPIQLVDCAMEECGVTYGAAAGMTVEALQLIARSGPQGFDHVMRLFLPGAAVDWAALRRAAESMADPR